MTNNKLKQLCLIICFFFNFENLALSKIKLEILYKINNEIVTNIDLDNEKKFLQFLNPNLVNLSDKQMENISNNSYKNRKIKEIELKKFFDLSKIDLGNIYIENFLTSTNSNKDILISSLDKINLEYKYFYNNFLIDNLWREYIFNKFKSTIYIDKNDLRNQIEEKNKEIEELNLSEIIFEISPNMSFDELSKKIYSEIDTSSFEAAASIYSISESKDFGGKLGWVKSNQITKEIYDIIRKSKEITKPMKIDRGYLIIKINEKRKINQEIDFEEELSKLIKIETEKKLNRLGYIYFNKIKKRIFISEK